MGDNYVEINCSYEKGDNYVEIMSQKCTLDAPDDFNFLICSPCASICDLRPEASVVVAGILSACLGGVAVVVAGFQSFPVADLYWFFRSNSFFTSSSTSF